jgi:mannose/fructose-specific phosphotransferase system component IIA
MKTSIFSPLLFLPVRPAKAGIHFIHSTKSIHRKHSNINDFSFLAAQNQTQLTKLQKAALIQSYSHSNNSVFFADYS